jgi:hypothetical protein
MEGNLLRFGAAHEIAIYRRGGVAWVADFRGAGGELFTAGEWFALNGRGSVARGTRTDAIGPLPADAIERIERLHQAEDRAPLAAAARWLGDHLAGFYRVPRMQRS